MEKAEATMDRKSIIERNPGSLDFIENNLNENSKDLKKILEELRNLSNQIKNMIGLLREEVENIKSLIIQKQFTTKNTDSKPISYNYPQTIQTYKAPIVIRCQTWGDFQTHSSGAERVAVTFRQSENIFEADALVGNQIVAYIGNFPEIQQLLKAWVAHNLDASDSIVFEGSLSRA